MACDPAECRIGQAAMCAEAALVSGAATCEEFRIGVGLALVSSNKNQSLNFSLRLLLILSLCPVWGMQSNKVAN
jgi:hypothetical protein